MDVIRAEGALCAQTIVDLLEVDPTATVFVAVRFLSGCVKADRKDLACVLQGIANREPEKCIEIAYIPGCITLYQEAAQCPLQIQ